MRLQEEIEKAYKLTTKEKDDATKRIDNRIAELHRQEEGEQSLKSENGNLAESHSDSGYFPREPKSVGAQSVVPSSAKVDKKFPTKELYFLIWLTLNVALYENNNATSVASAPTKPGERLDIDSIADTKLQQFFERVSEADYTI